MHRKVHSGTNHAWRNDTSSGMLRVIFFLVYFDKSVYSTLVQYCVGGALRRRVVVVVQ